MNVGILTFTSFPQDVKYFSLVDNNRLKSGGAWYWSYTKKNKRNTGTVSPLNQSFTRNIDKESSKQ